MRILVTGMSGLIGTAFASAMGSDHGLSALNRRVLPNVPTTQSSLDNFAGIRPAFDNQDVVVHLAAKIHDGFGWDELLSTNVIGSRNVFQAAADAGVRRLVFASSGAVVAGWELESPYRELVAGEYDKAKSVDRKSVV